eukprot:6210278-Pleurochrysis_carterae.AAC.3
MSVLSSGLPSSSAKCSCEHNSHVSLAYLCTYSPSSTRLPVGLTLRQQRTLHTHCDSNEAKKRQTSSRAKTRALAPMLAELHTYQSQSRLSKMVPDEACAYNQIHASAPHMLAGSTTHMLAGSTTHVFAEPIAHIFAGSTTHVFAGSTTHVFAEPIAHIFAGSTTHVFAGSTTHVFAGSTTHVFSSGPIVPVPPRAAQMCACLKARMRV